MSTATSTELLRLERELAQANQELGLDLAQAALDVAGIVDPTPVSDLVNGAISLGRGDLLGAGLSLISVVPYVGDALAKTTKGARLAKKISALRNKIAGLLAQIKRLKAVKAIPTGGLSTKIRHEISKKASERAALQACPRAKESILRSDTFKPVGLGNRRAKLLRQKGIGQRALSRMKKAKPIEPGENVKQYERNMDRYVLRHLKTFADEPIELLLQPGEKLYKLVPTGTKKISDSSAYFATESQMNAWRASGKSPADFFGLPLSSHAGSYITLEIVAEEPTVVLIGRVAPTAQVIPKPSGSIEVHTTGGGGQAVVSDRSAFSKPALSDKWK
jgi:hypothetical protein